MAHSNLVRSIRWRLGDSNLTFNTLIVDDKPRSAATHQVVLDELGSHCILAESPSKAIRLMKNLPSFDLVVCDLDFGGSPVPNDLGREVGQWMKSQKYPAHSAVFSAAFNEGDKKFRRAAEDFDAVIGKGAEPKEYEELVAVAREVRATRLRSSKLVPDPSLAKSHKAELVEVHKLSSESIGDHVVDRIRRGDHLLVAQPVVDNFNVGSPLFIWISSIDGGVLSEVYGQPNLFGFGESFIASISTLNEVLYTTYLELTDDEVGTGLENTKAFLKMIYEDLVINICEEADAD